MKDSQNNSIPTSLIPFCGYGGNLNRTGKYIRSSDKLFGKRGYFSNPSKKLCNDFFWGAEDFILVQLILFMQKIIKKPLSGYFLAYPPKCTTVHHSAVQLHFIQCPFPNRFQFGSEKSSSKFPSSFPNRIQFGSEEKLAIFQQTKIPNRFQFGSDFFLTKTWKVW